MNDREFADCLHDYMDELARYAYRIGSSSEVVHMISANLEPFAKTLRNINMKKVTSDFLRHCHNPRRDMCEQMWTRLFGTLIALQSHLRGMWRDSDSFLHLKSSSPFQGRLITFITNGGWMGEFNPFGTVQRSTILNEASRQTDREAALTVVLGTMITIPAPSIGVMKMRRIAELK